MAEGPIENRKRPSGPPQGSGTQRLGGTYPCEGRSDRTQSPLLSSLDPLVPATIISRAILSPSVPFVYKGWSLYKREVKLKRGPRVTIYFFSKKKPRLGEPIDLPKGLAVAENKRTGLPFLRRQTRGFYSRRVDEARAPAFAAPERVFLVRSYRHRFDGLQGMLESRLGPKYRIVTGKDIPAGNFLSSMSREMRSCAFGIVVLGGLKTTRKRGKTREAAAKYNMCFEYGLLVGMGLPVLLLLIGDEPVDLGVEFSDVGGEVYHKVRLRRGKPVGPQLRTLLATFLEDLPRLSKDRWKVVFEGLPAGDRRLAMESIRALLATDVAERGIV